MQAMLMCCIDEGRWLALPGECPGIDAALLREAAAIAMNDIIAAVKALGVAEADIQTTNISLNPQYGSGSAPKIVGYQISEQIVVTVRDLDKAGDGDAQYTLLTNEQGGIVDDLIAYRRGTDDYLLVVNASNVEPDHASLSETEDVSADFALLAVQGQGQGARHVHEAVHAGRGRGPRIRAHHRRDCRRRAQLRRVLVSTR